MALDIDTEEKAYHIGLNYAREGMDEGELRAFLRLFNKLRSGLNQDDASDMYLAGLQGFIDYVSVATTSQE